MQIHSARGEGQGSEAPAWDSEVSMALITRRRFLSYLSGLLSGLIALVLAIPLIRFYVGNAFNQQPARWLKLGPESEVRTGVPQLFQVSYVDQDGWRETNRRQEVYAATLNGRDFLVMSNVCTHLGCPVHWDEQSKHFLCPCHGGEFAIDGKVLHGPPPKPLTRLEHKVADGVLYVRVGGA